MRWEITFKFGPDQQTTEILIPDSYELAEEKVAKLCAALRYEGAINLEVRLVNR